VVEATDEKLYLAARNLPHVEVIEVPALNPLSLAGYDKVLMTVAAVKLIDERFRSRDAGSVSSSPEARA